MMDAETGTGWNLGISQAFSNEGQINGKASW